MIFTKEELAESSITGNKCNVFRAAGPKTMDPHKLEALKAAGPKKVLDPRKLEALVGEVLN